MESAQLLYHLQQQQPALSPEELAELVGAFTLRKIKKRQFIGQPGVVANYRTYIVQGAFRAYIIDPAGRDHTINFAIDDWWVLDPTSYFSRAPAQLFIVALEDSTILELDYVTQQRLMQASRGIETLFRLQTERGAAYHHHRLLAALTRTAEERYQDFLATYPALLQRLPQYVIASYLGMSKEFLSRIRNHGAAPKK
jgi:CRP-like cAMP-binding protein